MEEFLYQLTPSYVITKKKDYHPPLQDHFVLKPFSIKELDLALKSRNNSMPGYDDIFYVLPREWKILLLEAFNLIWIEGEQVRHLKRIIIVPIPKPNKVPNFPGS